MKEPIRMVPGPEGNSDTVINTTVDSDALQVFWCIVN
jgi:hypothetical protein